MKQLTLPEQGRWAPFLQPYVSTFFHQPWLVFFSILAVNALLVAVLAFLEIGYGVDHWNLVRDTNAIAGQPAYFGFYSNIGVLIWAAASSIALFTWLALRNHAVPDAQARLRVLRFGGLFTAIACLDDLFMLHENSYVIGISDKVVMAGYALFLLAFVASTLPILHATRWLLLCTALASLAWSTLFDMTTDFPGSVLAEEVCKLTGISLLAAYLVTLSVSALRDAVHPQAAARGRLLAQHRTK